MHEAATEPHETGDARSRWRLIGRASLLVIVALLCASRRSDAQLPPYPEPLTNTEDARTLPKGAFLLKAMNVWTRIDQVYDAAADSAQHLHPLGLSFTFDSLGVRQFPALAAAQSALRTLTGDPNFTLNLGRTFSTADARYVTTPFTLQYGLTDRLTIGVMVPIVQTQVNVFVELNPRRLNGNTGANVGPNPAQLGNSTAIASNTTVIGQLDQANAALTAFLANCAQSGTCSTQDVTTANSALAKTISYKAAIQTLYGTGQQASAFAPFQAAQQAVLNSLNALAATINGLLGTTFDFSGIAGAQAPAANLQLQQLVTARPGPAYDSLGSPTRLGLGDIEISALYKLVDDFRDSTGVRLRATMRGALIVGTAFQTPYGTVPYEVGTGTGQTGADAGLIADIGLGRKFMATVSGQYTAYFRSTPYSRLPNSDYSLFPMDTAVSGTWREGPAIQAEAMPRFLLTDYFTLNAAYTFRHQGASTFAAPGLTEPPLFSATSQQSVGFGFSYSTVARYARSLSVVPIEIFYQHLQTIMASGGLTPKYSRDQIELRIYYRLPRRGR